MYFDFEFGIAHVEVLLYECTGLDYTATKNSLVLG